MGLEPTTSTLRTSRSPLCSPAQTRVDADQPITGPTARNHWRPFTTARTGTTVARPTPSSEIVGADCLSRRASHLRTRAYPRTALMPRASRGDCCALWGARSARVSVFSTSAERRQLGVRDSSRSVNPRYVVEHCAQPRCSNLMQQTVRTDVEPARDPSAAAGSPRPPSFAALRECRRVRCFRRGPTITRILVAAPKSTTSDDCS
jgi:hypothetical protein